ncbi:putative ribosomal protein S15 [Peziza echinospora]|nr:putative ribosomal protein S15 [Peziza echinospora]
MAALRIPTMSALRCTNGGLSSSSTRPLFLAFQALSLHTSAPLAVTGGDNATRRRHDPYAMAKAKKMKEANIQRQAELSRLRSEAAADPVVGHTTAFTEKILTVPTALPSVDNTKRSQIGAAQLAKLAEQARLNHLLMKGELEQFLDDSKKLIFPDLRDNNIISDADKLSHAKHVHSVEAVRRITSLALGSKQDLTRQNKQDCIETFGRHNTDSELPPDPIHESALNRPKQFEKTPRVGPDTGSSEVQAAILTAKILALAEHVKANKKDKMNKRNLRLLTHKRQKILTYLKRKEKGGIRYRNVMAQLGLDEDAISQELML